MLPFHTLIVPDKNNEAPLFKQIKNRLIALIREGALGPGTFLPATRHMAGILGVNRKTIIGAYEELYMDEWIIVVPKKGYCVAPDLPVIKPRSFNPVDNFSDRNKFPAGMPVSHDARPVSSADIYLNDGLPDADLAPFKDIAKIYRDSVAAKRLKQLMGTTDEGGLSLLRESASRFINGTRGMNIGPDKMVITRGAQMAIFIAVSILVSPGDKVVVTEPNYMFANDVIANAGADIIRVPVDQHGMDIDALENILRQHIIKLVYIVPHHHHPTTVTLAADRRAKLLELIEKYGFYVIEDDYDYDFHYQNSPILPLASSYHGGRIIYIGSFTKILAPSIRVGYLIAGSDIISKAVRLRRMIDLRGDTFIEYALAQMIDNGGLSRHINKSLKLYSRRCDHCCALLEQKLQHAVDFTKPAGGMAVWLRFKPKYKLSRIISDSGNRGLVLTGMSFEQPGNPNHNGLRFGFASHSREVMERAIDILAEVIKAQKL